MGVQRQASGVMSRALSARRSTVDAGRTVALVLMLAVYPASYSAAQQAKVGASAPDFTLNALDSTTVHLAALHGRPVVINFWATWCRPCNNEMPELARRFAQHHEANLVVLAVNADGEPVDRIRRFASALSLPFPVLSDPKIRTATAYGVVRLPVTVFVDSAGIVRIVHAGPIQPSQLDAALRTILPLPTSQAHEPEN